MKNKLVFRILGALSSALIVASVFIPFVSVTGYSQSLWQTYEAINTLYLPIMIIVFGVIGVLSFAINIKTELAYTSSGALIFFLITQTIPVIEQNLLSTLSVGYYCLATGTILTGIMAFICNLRTKKKDIVKASEQEPLNDQMSVINKIDKLYDDQPVVRDDSNIEINSNIEPTIMNKLEPIQIIEPTMPIVDDVPNEPVQEVTLDQNNITPVNEIVSNEISNEVAIETNKIESVTEPEFNMQSVNPAVAEFTSQSTPVMEQVEQPTNLVTAQFEQPVNPVTAQFEQPTNPVTQQFNNQINQVPVEPVNEVQFTNPVEPVELQQTELQSMNGEMIQQPSNEPKIDVMADSTNNNGSNLDIFG